MGIFKVLARFWDRLPDVSGKLFLTFTLDPKNCAVEETAFEDSHDWLHKVFFQLRHGIEQEGKIYVIDAPYCIKVEFHESGWGAFPRDFPDAPVSAQRTAGGTVGSGLGDRPVD